MFMLKPTKIVLLLFILFSCTSSNAKAIKSKNQTLKTKSLSTLYPMSKPSELIADMETGVILHAVNEEELIYPASLAKLMTAYVVFEMLESKKLSVNDEIIVSKKASIQKPSKLGLRIGEKIKTKDAVYALVVKSANDAAIALAEKISGTEENFVKLMNKKASILGMKHTVFRRASGWHHPKQYSTAIDLAKLSIALKRDFPQYYSMFSISSFMFKNRIIKGHNIVTEKYKGATGLKTGFTGPSGFNLITTAARNGKSLIGIVTGSKTALGRNKKMVSLLDKHFNMKTNFALSPRKKKVSVLPNKIKKQQ